MRVFAVTVLCLAMFAGVSSAAEQKIAVVDMSALLRAHPDTEQAEEALEQQIEEIDAMEETLKKQLEAMGKEVDALMMQEKNRALSEAKRAELRGLAEEKYKDLRMAERDAKKKIYVSKKDLAEQKQEMHKRIVSEISDVVADYAKDKGFALVLDSSGQGLNGMPTVVHASAEADITEELEKLLKKGK